MDGSSLMDQLIHAISDQKTAFCCGGTVRIMQDSAVGRFDKMTCDDGEITCAPVVLRWDLPSGKTIRKLTLPPDDGVEDPATIKALLKHCTPATFGKDGEEVLDGSYREAVKLDTNQFLPISILRTSVSRQYYPSALTWYCKVVCRWEDDLPG